MTLCSLPGESDERLIKKLDKRNVQNPKAHRVIL
jgi:hypothetical protein